MNLTGRELEKQRSTRKTQPFDRREVEFDSATERVIMSARIKNCQELFFVFESIWVPQRDGENRETGENPVRSRHCDETSADYTSVVKAVGL